MLKTISCSVPRPKLNNRFGKGDAYWMRWGRPRARSREHRRRCRSTGGPCAVIRWYFPRWTSPHAPPESQPRALCWERALTGVRWRLAGAEPDARPSRCSAARGDRVRVRKEWRPSWVLRKEKDAMGKKRYVAASQCP